LPGTSKDLDRTILAIEIEYDVEAVKADVNLMLSSLVLTESIVHVAAVPPTRQLGLDE
jgi:hypothetical protein